MQMYYYFKSTLFERLEQKRVEKLFYSLERFQKKDRALLEVYQRKSPYQISKEYLTAHNARNPHVYGETPLTTMAKIVSECHLTKEDVVIEMGAGRGRVALFLAEWLGCEVYAYEQIPAFIEKMIPSANMHICAQDMFSAPFSASTAVYLYGTLLDEIQIKKLAEVFPMETKIITVSYPLSEYDDRYLVRKCFSGRFPWGKTEVYWNERVGR